MTDSRWTLGLVAACIISYLKYSLVLVLLLICTANTAASAAAYHTIQTFLLQIFLIPVLML